MFASFFCGYLPHSTPKFAVRQCHSKLCSKVYPVVESFFGSIVSQAFPLKGETEDSNPEDKLKANVKLLEEFFDWKF